MDPPRAACGTALGQPEESTSTGNRGNKERQGREGGSRGWRKFGGSACCRIYIPCLATISIGQDRKYTIEGSSATDKDYPIENKTKQKKRQMG